MIVRLKRKLLFSIMLFVSSVLAAFIITINVIPAMQNRNVALKILVEAADNSMGASANTAPSSVPEPSKQPLPAEKQQPAKGESSAPRAVPPKSKNVFSSSNIITVHTDLDGNIESISAKHENMTDEEQLSALVQQIISKDIDKFGLINGQYYIVRKSQNGYLFALLDGSAIFVSSRQILFWSVTAGAAVWMLCALLAALLIGRLTEPLEIAMEKQKQFISDAEHEFNTPISTISSNVNVLESDIGENKWLGYIRSEAERMSRLVKDMMSLARMENADIREDFEELDLGECIYSSVLPYEATAFERGITIVLNIQPNIMMCGNRSHIMQLMNLLLSNAVKYGNDAGKISVSLTRERRYAKISVYNTGEGIPPNELDKVFERFYRVDKTRSRGGCGLGLSIALNIVNAHNGKINVSSEYGKWAKFDVRFPCHAPFQHQQ